MHNQTCLDLHGLSHQQASEFVLDWIGKKNPPYTIITGNSIKMQKKIVIRHLENNITLNG